MPLRDGPSRARDMDRAGPFCRSFRECSTALRSRLRRADARAPIARGRAECRERPSARPREHDPSRSVPAAEPPESDRSAVLAVRLFFVGDGVAPARGLAAERLDEVLEALQGVDDAVSPDAERSAGVLEQTLELVLRLEADARAALAAGLEGDDARAGACLPGDALVGHELADLRLPLAVQGAQARAEAHAPLVELLDALDARHEARELRELRPLAVSLPDGHGEVDRLLDAGLHRG